MAYRAAAVANEFLDLASKAGRQLTQIEIQKLVYFAHGWYLALKDEPAIGELVEAWKYGPVVRSLYDNFRSFGSDPITKKAVSWSMEGGKFRTQTPSIQSDNQADDRFTVALIGAVWQKYGSLPPFKLVEITHLPDSPWFKAYNEKKTYIPNESIQAYFKSLKAQG